ncbi:DUF1648 domain-containing protein [Corynebacterium pelargi]|uniref:Uncharacterized protein n=1 Tax=Corynebacterium pelargi TaxID=1471400 RepID=A0A410WA19_9CORY|nr:DUF1648 domain-containing protein [Corynebacterium pelargi]QAU52800.1 hypothetical protein CPELA_07700 [Corynebacterium pelargi]GGG78858.1 hypothetical protein GCM10007338_16310 [Corynebacterium pelargi]
MDNAQLWQRIDHPRPSTRSVKWLYLLCALIIGGAMAYVGMRWEDIPSPVPTHWGADGPDDFAPKSISAVFMGSFIFIGTIVLMVVVTGIATYAMKQNESEDHPIDRRLQSELNRVLTAKMIAYISLALALVIAVVQVCSVLPQYQHVMDGMGLFIGIMILVLVVLVLLIWWASAQTRGLQRAIEKAQQSGRMPEGAEVEGVNHHYKFGLFYYNPEDQRVIVERRYGIGIDFNYARWQGKLFAAIIFGTVVACVALPFLLS